MKGLEANNPSIEIDEQEFLRNILKYLLKINIRNYFT